MSKQHIRACGEALKASAVLASDDATEDAVAEAEVVIEQFMVMHTPTLCLQLWQVQQALLSAVLARADGKMTEAREHTHAAVTCAGNVAIAHPETE